MVEEERGSSTPRTLKCSTPSVTPLLLITEERQEEGRLPLHNMLFIKSTGADWVGPLVVLGEQG